MPNIKNILIFVAIGAVLVLGYVFFLRPDPEPENLIIVSPAGGPIDASTPPTDADITVGQDFLNLLLSVKNIKLDESLFADPAFSTLRDSSITLLQEGNEGRPNPFAPIGAEGVAPIIPPTLGDTPSTGAGN